MRKRIQRISATGKPTTLRARETFIPVEEPLEVRIDGKPHHHLMRTPGHDVELVMGMLFSQGRIARAHDVHEAMHCASDGAENTYNVLSLTLRGTATSPAQTHAHTSENVSTLPGSTESIACGVRSTDSIAAVVSAAGFTPGDDNEKAALEFNTLTALPEILASHRPLLSRTHGTHAAGLFTQEGALLVSREDVVQSGAVDKVIGWALQNNYLPLHRTVLLIPEEISFEVMQKAAIAGATTVATTSVASSLAVLLAEEVGITLIGSLTEETAVVYTHPERIGA